MTVGMCFSNFSLWNFTNHLNDSVHLKSKYTGRQGHQVCVKIGQEEAVKLSAQGVVYQQWAWNKTSILYIYLKIFLLGRGDEFCGEDFWWS